MAVTRLPALTNLSSIKDASSCDLSKPKNEIQNTLQKIVKEHHALAAPLREPQLLLHDHMPHILGSAYDIGLGSDYLHECFDSVMETLVSTDNADFVRGPNKIVASRIREHFGQKEYSMAFVDFFDEEFTRAGGDWKKVVEDYLFSNKEPMMNGLTSGQFASEGMSLLCTDYAGRDTIMNKPQTTTEAHTTSLVEIFDRIRNDKRLDGSPRSGGVVNFDKVSEKFGDTIVQYYAAWEIKDTHSALEHICDLATMCAMTTYDKQTGEFDFPLIHLMTSAHALRSLWPMWPSTQHEKLLRAWALMACTLYVCQQRPELDIALIEGVTADRDWDSIFTTAGQHPAKFDVHFFKCVRAPRAFENTWGEKGGFYRKAAIRYLDGFRGWGGFGEGIPGFDEKKEGWQAPELRTSS